MSRFDASKFSPQPDEELICGICMNVLDNPVESPCRHVFCNVCIERCLQQKSECPLCRKKLKPHYLKNVLPLVQNMISKLKMKCDNYENGCTDLISKENFLSHVKSCGYVQVKCKYDECHKQLLLKDCEEHEKNICVYRDLPCKNGCGLVVKWADRSSHNCMESLVSHVKVLNGRINCLEGKVVELNSVIVGLSSKLEDCERAQYHNNYNRDDDTSSHIRSPSPSTWSRPLSVDSDNSGSKSLNISPTGWGSQSSVTSEGSVANSPERNNSYNEGNGEDVDFEDGYNEDFTGAEYVASSPAYEEAVDISSSSIYHNEETSDPPNGDISENNNTAPADLSVNGEDTQSDHDTVIGFSGSVVTPEENGNEDTVARGHESNDGTDERESHNENMPQATIHSSLLDSENNDHTETNNLDAGGMASTSASTGASQFNSKRKAKKQTKNNKRRKTTSQKRQNEMTEGSTSINGQENSTNISSQSTRNQSHPNELESNVTNNNQNSDSRTNRDSSCPNLIPPTSTKSGPVTRRSARIQNMQVAQESNIPDVRIPKSAADLLLEYEDDSSSDESWSPNGFD